MILANEQISKYYFKIEKIINTGDILVKKLCISF